MRATRRGEPEDVGSYIQIDCATIPGCSILLFFLVALIATLLPLQPVGPYGLPIMIGASARQEPGIRGHPPGSWRKPRVPSHCYDDAAQFREAVFSGASPERVR